MTYITMRDNADSIIEKKTQDRKNRLHFSKVSKFLKLVIENLNSLKS